MDLNLCLPLRSRLRWFAFCLPGNNLNHSRIHASALSRVCVGVCGCASHVFLGVCVRVFACACACAVVFAVAVSALSLFSPWLCLRVAASALVLVFGWGPTAPRSPCSCGEMLLLGVLERSFFVVAVFLRRFWRLPSVPQKPTRLGLSCGRFGLWPKRRARHDFGSCCAPRAALGKRHRQHIHVQTRC